MERLKRGWDKTIGVLTPSRSPSPAHSHHESRQSRSVIARHSGVSTPSGTRNARSTDASPRRGRSGGPAVEASDGRTEGIANRGFMAGIRRSFQSCISRDPSPGVGARLGDLDRPSGSRRRRDASAATGHNVDSEVEASQGPSEGLANRTPIAGLPRALQPHPPGLTTSRSPSAAPSADTLPQVLRQVDTRQTEMDTPSGHHSALEGDTTGPLPITGDGSEPVAEAPEGLTESIDNSTPNAGARQAPDFPAHEARSPDSVTNARQAASNMTATAPAENPQPSATKDKPASTWYTAFKATVDLVVQVSDVFPPLKSAAAAVKALTDVYDAFSDNREEFDKLSERVAFLEKILSGRSKLPPDIQDRRDGLARAVDDLSKQLEEKTSQTKLKGVVFAKADQQEVLRLIREINFAIEFAMLDVSVSNETLILRAVDGIDWVKDHSIIQQQKIQEALSGIARGVAHLIKAEQLKKLGNVENYGFFNKNQRGQCVPGSRVALLAQLLAWAQDPTSAHVFWLSGMAGTGKTAVSETFCRQLSNRGLLGASFFCSIKDQDLSDVYHIIPTLAKALAKAFPEFGQALSTILESLSKDPVREMELNEQYNTLIIRPAKEAFGDRDSHVLLCVDALDECKAIAALKDFLNTILSKKLNAPIKIFFTSRPEVTIKQEVESSTHSSHRQSLRLHDIEKDIHQETIPFLWLPCGALGCPGVP